MKTHWKQLVNSNYIGCYSLPEGKDMKVTIESVVKEEIVGAKGKKQDKAVIHLKGQKPMIINVTNFNTLTDLFSTPYVEDWIGKSFTIFASTALYAGQTVEALRIRKVAPIKPKLTPSSEKWDGAVKALKAKNVTITQIKEIYELNEKDEKEIQNQSIGSK